MRALIFFLLFLACMYVATKQSALGFTMMIVLYCVACFYYSDDQVAQQYPIPPKEPTHKTMIVTEYDEETEKFKTEVKCLK